MSRTVTALYDTKAEAEAARQRLGSAVDLERVKIIDKSHGSNDLGSLYMAEEDRHAYGEGLRRGGYLLCAEVGTGEDADRIVQLLEESAVDLEERQESWRNEGWQPYSGAGMASGAGTTTGGAQMRSGGGFQESGRVVEEERIPVIEEELRIGKREVERGGARVRSYVRETPVHEQVTLREEHVEVERRPVDQPVSATGAAAAGTEGLMEERSIEMRETAEEAVVQKVANVKEEVVVRKTAEERTEQIDETVRHTEVEVEEGARGDRSAFGSFGSGEGSGGTGGSLGTAGDRSSTDFERNNSR
jgi:uncharacterized protein (TIGR02271 family)